MFLNYEESKKEWLSIMGKWEIKKEKLNEQHPEVVERSWEQLQIHREGFLEFRDDIMKIEDEIKEKYGEKTLYEFLCDVGFCPPDGEWEWVEGIGAIDISLADIIKHLNEMGYPTKFCCSGIRKEHRNAKNMNYVKGYIMFDCNDQRVLHDVREAAIKLRMYAESILTPFSEPKKESQTITVRNVHTYDWQIKWKWKRFIKEMEKIKHKNDIACKKTT